MKNKNDAIAKLEDDLDVFEDTRASLYNVDTRQLQLVEIDIQCIRYALKVLKGMA